MDDTSLVFHWPEERAIGCGFIGRLRCAKLELSHLNQLQIADCLVPIAHSGVTSRRAPCFRHGLDASAA